jgi:hypothetical protein
MAWGPRWTEEELSILSRTYPAYGSIEASRRLRRQGFDRSPSAAQKRAVVMGLVFNEGKHRRRLVPLVDAHARYRNYGDDRGTAHRYIVEAARRDGVLQRAHAYPRVYMAPREWVDRYVELLAAQEEAEAEIERTWLTTPQVAELLGTTHKSVATLVGPGRSKKVGPMYAAVNRMTHLRLMRVRGRNGSVALYWEPASVHREVAWYRAARNARIASRRRSGNGVMERRVA